MFGFRKSPVNELPTPNSFDPSNPFDSDTESDNKSTITPVNELPTQNSFDPSNPFDSDTESDNKSTITPVRTSSKPVFITPNQKTNPFDADDFGRVASSSSSYSSRSKQNNKSQSKRDLESMSAQEFESYAVNKAEETTNSVKNCLKIAEDIRQDGVRTLETLHQQGQQIHMTHMTAVDMDRDLSRGEKLLNNLGGMFSMPWKPKKTRNITGPLTSRDENDIEKKSSPAQREKLGLDMAPKGRPVSRMPPLDPTNSLQKVEVEKVKQDDALSDLSNILCELKGMATDMGSELNRQNKDLNYLQDDVDELSSRVKGANQRARRLIGK